MAAGDLDHEAPQVDEGPVGPRAARSHGAGPSPASSARARPSSVRLNTLRPSALSAVDQALVLHGLEGRIDRARDSGRQTPPLRSVNSVMIW